MKPRDIMALEESLGYHFQRQGLIEQALTHSSQAREVEALGAVDPSARQSDNEQFEFLGDAVLGLVTTEALFHRFPGFQEGHLSKLRAHLVGQRHLLRVAEQLEIGHYLRLGRGEEKSGGRNKATLLVDALEAILAALYLDGGWTVARDFILRTIVEPELAHMKLETSAIPVMDFKSALQEKLQAGGLRQPVYALVKEEGPEHKKTFTVEVRLPDVEVDDFVARAEGPTKKRAEQEAARQVLEHLASATEWQRVRASKDESGL
ncbi:MAG TPA: ribonuclease III [Terriglobales bacterium]|nr:ribonuclease III [Terriglobales bacterium]